MSEKKKKNVRVGFFIPQILAEFVDRAVVNSKYGALGRFHFKNNTEFWVKAAFFYLEYLRKEVETAKQSKKQGRGD